VSEVQAAGRFTRQTFEDCDGCVVVVLSVVVDRVDVVKLEEAAVVMVVTGTEREVVVEPLDSSVVPELIVLRDVLYELVVVGAVVVVGTALGEAVVGADGHNIPELAMQLNKEFPVVVKPMFTGSRQLSEGGGVAE
jgi:hypothetical protein